MLIIVWTRIDILPVLLNPGGAAATDTHFNLPEPVLPVGSGHTRPPDGDSARSHVGGHMRKEFFRPSRNQSGDWSPLTGSDIGNEGGSGSIADSMCSTRRRVA